MDMMWYRRRGLMAAPHIESVSGSVASFNSDYNKIPVNSLICNIEPIQDLHGYDSPWPAGGGVNKADLTGATAHSNGTYGMYVTVDGEEITLAGTWTNSNSTGEWRFLRVPNISSDLNIVVFESTSGNHVNGIRQDGTNNRLIITVTKMVKGQAYTIKFKIVAYKGSTAPTEWTPYSNICPISARTGLIVSRSGADTSDPTTISVNWETEAGTVYGGTLDVVSGVLTVDRAMVDMGTLTWASWSESGTLIFNAIVDGKKQQRISTLICSQYKANYSVLIWIQLLDCEITGSGNSKVYIRDQRFTDDAAFKTAMDGVQLVYELATPQSYQLTPQEVRTLLGVNNIWCDSGDVTVDYWKWGK